ncbi:MAG TPA: heat-inducible transcriptional repressor HrcA [Anaerolineae bacterium]|nr:heat-inducible transcriptional repressor HrcA [Anaerolineae bacterium]
MDDLTPRQQLVLGLVIRDYIATAQPVGSKTIQEYGLGVSSATIRNEMAVLDDFGYLTQPHTSAGRIPTERGYRYFVERLMRESHLPLDEQRTIRHQFHQVGVDLEQWMRLAASVLARTAQTAAVVTSMKTEQCRLRHLELISLRDTLIMLIVVLEGGLVQQQVLTLDEAIGQDTLAQIANRLNDLCVGGSIQRVRSCLRQVGAFEQQVLNVILQIMKRVDNEAGMHLYRDGLINILDQPEFTVAESARNVVHLFEDRTLLEDLLTDMLEVGGVQVIIGGEGRWNELRECSLVVSPYGVSGEATGALGVMGPMRMPYSRAISTVRYVAGLLSDLFRDLYGRAEELSMSEEWKRD